MKKEPKRVIFWVDKASSRTTSSRRFLVSRLSFGFFLFILFIYVQRNEKKMMNK